MKIPFQGKTLDLSFLGCVSDFDVPAEIPCWKDLNTDAMRLVYETIHLDASKNNVILNGEVVKASDYLEEIVVGFRTMYNMLMYYRNDLLAPEGPLSWFVGCPIRYVFRPTFIYEKLLHRLIHPLFLRDGVAPWIEMQILKKPLLRSDADPSLWAMIEAELEALARFDLPHFSTRAEGHDLFTDGENIIPNAFGTSALDQIRACLTLLSVDDMVDQLSLIRDALVEGAASASAAPVAPAAL
jgi:lantibiotic modifying enzyme